MNGALIPAKLRVHDALVVASTHGANAVTVLGAGATYHRGEGKGAAVVFGLKALAKLAFEAGNAALREETLEAMEDASTCYEQAIAVCNVVIDNGVGGELLYPAETLMALAKDTIDNAISALATEEEAL
ncbi:hypothetical protein [Polaromonas sp.]|uniref:hypothetical protein n=1 Tax=Polaromonas sp. TaxID=1869339 RepID=UPI00352A8F6D